jgi:carbon storage regulator
MLVLSRRPKERLVIGGEVAISVLTIEEGSVRLGIVPLSEKPIDLEDGPLGMTTHEALCEPEVTVEAGEHMVVVSPKVGRGIVINENTQLTIVEIRGDKVRLGITASCDVPITRSEVETHQTTSLPGQRRELVPHEVLLSWVARHIQHYLDTHPDITLQQLAARVGVSPATITRWKSQQTNVSRVHLQPLLDALKINLQDLARELNVSSVTLPDIKPRGPTGRRRG